MKKAYLVLLLMTLAAALFAGTPFEDDLKTYDPYIADLNFGFDALFVNPAGAAGNTGFVGSVEFGTFGTYGTYMKIKDAIELYDTISQYENVDLTAEDLDADDAAMIQEFLTDNLSESDLDALLAGTSLAGEDLGSLTVADLEGLTDADVSTITSNVQDSGMGADLLDMQFDIAIEAKAGFLAKGWGGGLYFRESMPFSAGAAGFTNMMGEAGIVGGGGFKLGPVHIGAAAHFGILTVHNNMTLEESQEFWNQSMTYGYTWGVNVGAAVKLGPLSVGVVIRDLLGSTQRNLAYNTTWATLTDDMTDDNINWDYEFSMDMDLGITLEPDWKGFSPKFSLDYYNIIDLFRDIADGVYDDAEPNYIAREVLGNMRLGVNVELIDMIKLGFQYYNNFFTIGAGVDLWIVEVQAEFMFDDSWMYGDVENLSFNNAAKVGGNIMVKVYLGDPKRQNSKKNKK